MSKKIMTVLGAIEPDSLGFTSMHEHILCDTTKFRDRVAPLLPPDSPVDEEDPISLSNLGILKHTFVLSNDVLRMTDVETMTREVSYFKEAGGSAIVDMSTPGIRCHPEGTRKISENTGVHIVAPTGIYAYDTWPDQYKEMDVQDLTAYMLNEVESGIEGTDIYPGHIKVALDVDNQPKELAAIKAAARVSLDSNLPVTVHQGVFLSEDHSQIIVDLMKNEGVNLSRVIIAHCSQYFVEYNLDKLILEPDCWKLNIDHSKRLLDQGLNISIDLFGQQIWDAEILSYINPTDWQQMAGLVALIKAGYSEQIVLGTDTFMKLMLRSGGSDGYCRLTDFVVPTLSRLGISDKDVRNLTHENPKRLLSV